MSPREFSGTEDVAFNYQLPDHSNKLWRSFHSQWQASQFCDLKVVTTNGIVSMHACVWAAFTDHTTNMVQQDSEFRLSVSLAVSSEVVMEIATALYTGTFSPPKNLLAQLYSTTKLIGCSDLHDLISQHCQENSIDLIEECGPTNSQHCQENSIDLIEECGPTNSQHCQENSIDLIEECGPTNSQHCQENTIDLIEECGPTNSQHCQENTIDLIEECRPTNSQHCQENSIDLIGPSGPTNSQHCQEEKNGNANMEIKNIQIEIHRTPPLNENSKVSGFDHSYSTDSGIDMYLQKEPFNSVLVEVDSTLASSTELARLFNSYVVLKDFSSTKEQQNYFLEYNDVSVKREITSIGTSALGGEDNSLLGVNTVDETFLSNSMEETCNASQSSSQYIEKSLAVKSGRKRKRRCKPLKKGKNVSDPKKTARAEDQTVEIIPEKQSTQSTKSSNPARKRKKSSCTVDGGLFGDKSHMQCPTEKEPQPKRSRTATLPPAQSLGPSQLTKFSGGSQESTPLHFHVSQDEDIHLGSVEFVPINENSAEDTKLVLRDEMKDEGALNLKSGDLAKTPWVTQVDLSSLTFLLTHLHKDTSPSSRQSCPICHQVFFHKVSLSKHLFDYHEICPISRQCYYCGYVAKTDKDLVQHSAKFHEDGFPFKCPSQNCGFCSIKRSIVVKHMQVHLNLRIESCKKCGGIFRTKYSLEAHIKNCANLREHVCDLCGKRFNHKGSLTKHVNNIHKRIKKHLCTHCGKMFSDRNNLKRHLLIHNDNFPYSCDFCSAKFRHSNTLKGHLKTKHNIDKCEQQKVP